MNTYKVGDTANGYVLKEDGQWHPITEPQNLLPEPKAAGRWTTKKILAVAVTASVAITVGMTVASGMSLSDEEQPVAYTAPTSQENKALNRPGMCILFDQGTPPADLYRTGDFITEERAKVAAECPEHLAAFDAEAAPRPDTAPAPAPSPTATAPALSEAEDRYVTAYRAKSLDFGTPDQALIDTAGLACVALRNRPEADVAKDLRWKGLSDSQVKGLIYAASPERCIALGWTG